MNIPRLSEEQLVQSRKAAIAARHRRAEFKRKIRDSELSFAQALDVARQDEVLAHIRVLSLLQTLPRIGEKRASSILAKLGIAPSRRIRGLGKYQIEALRNYFE